jgi:hypothetical protein
MRKTIPRTVLAASLVSLTRSVAIAGQILVADEGGGTLSRLDPDTNGKTQIEIGIAPHNVDLSKDGSIALAVGMPLSSHANHSLDGQLVTVPISKNGTIGPPNRFHIGGHPPR